LADIFEFENNFLGLHPKETRFVLLCV